jgi:hypothetical protein
MSCWKPTLLRPADLSYSKTAYSNSFIWWNTEIAFDKFIVRFYFKLGLWYIDIRRVLWLYLIKVIVLYLWVEDNSIVNGCENDS